MYINPFKFDDGVQYKPAVNDNSSQRVKREFAAL